MSKIEKPVKNSWKPELAQNQNGMNYCTCCEQAWETCSCPARNTGRNQAIEQSDKYWEQEMKKKDEIIRHLTEGLVKEQISNKLTKPRNNACNNEKE
jgi:hypothetical protein